MSSGIKDAFIKAAELLEQANEKMYEAFLETHKWGHPVDGEILGLQVIIMNKIDRLKWLKDNHEE